MGGTTRRCHHRHRTGRTTEESSDDEDVCIESCFSPWRRRKRLYKYNDGDLFHPYGGINRGESWHERELKRRKTEQDRCLPGAQVGRAANNGTWASSPDNRTTERSQTLYECTSTAQAPYNHPYSVLQRDSFRRRRRHRLLKAADPSADGRGHARDRPRVDLHQGARSP